MNNIKKELINKIDKTFKNIDIDKYIYYNYNHNINDRYIDNLFKNIYKNDYDEILEKSIKLCSLSYLKKQDIEKKVKWKYFKFSNDLEKCKYYIIYNKLHDKIIFVFRGTSYISNAIKGLKYYRKNYDFLTENEKKQFIKWRNKNIYTNKFLNKKKIPLKDDTEIEIHKGFYDESLNLLNEVINDILLIVKNKKTEIIFMGHSMGILSNMISLMIKIKLSRYVVFNNFLTSIKFYNITINSPTIGNKNYNLLKFYYGINKTFQFYNNQDNFVKYGYNMTFFGNKKIRHTSYMLKNNDIVINNNYYISIDYGKNIEKIYDKLKKKDKIKNDIIFYHSYFKLPYLKKLMFI
jgi:hypothetical protein